MHPLPNLSALQQWALKDYFLAKNTSPYFYPKVSFLEKLRNEQKLKKLLKEAEAKLTPMLHKDPQHLTLEEQKVCKAHLRALATTIDEQHLLFQGSFLKDFIHQGFLESTQSFFILAKQYEEGFDFMDLFQAVRNVWIMNCLQMMFHLPLTMTDSVFAYSMLYPYTDNFLDDPTISREAKALFNKHLTDGIQGMGPTDLSPYEEKVHKLLHTILEQYPRDAYLEVWQSIQAIQEAQKESLLQNTSKKLSEEMLLSLSFSKGGTSVLADGFLVKGTLSSMEMRFIYGYGAFLQLMDDLQDQEEDSIARHQTLYSTHQEEVPLDELLMTLLSFIDITLKPSPHEDAQMTQTKSIIQEATRVMIGSIVGKNPSLVSKSLYLRLEQSSKVRLKFYKDLENIFAPLGANFKTPHTSPISHTP